MKTLPFLLSTCAAIAMLASPAAANDRYAQRPPVVVSRDLSAPWVMQLGHTPGSVVRQPSRQRAVSNRQQQPTAQQRRASRQAAPDAMRTAAVAPEKRAVKPHMNPIFLPQDVAYDGPEGPGTIVIDSNAKFLYHVTGDGMARRYGVGVGKEGFGWTGSENVTRKAVWPEWRPPAEMIARERKNGKILPTLMAGGPSNPLGARALYLGDTLYRIHGTNAPWTIGTNVSSGCIRMRNEDVTELYERVNVGTKVIVR